MWARDGRQLFYQAARGELMAVEIRAGATFEWVTPRVVFDASGYQMNHWHPTYDVSPDGERFLMVRQVADPNVGLVLVLNWFHELEMTLAGLR